MVWTKTQLPKIVGSIALSLLLLGGPLGCDDFLTKDRTIGVKPEDTGSSSSSGGGGSASPDDDDEDGLSNDIEGSFAIETQVSDTDHDGFGDGLEFVVNSGDPLNGNDSPVSLNRSRLLQPSEVIINDPDADGDGLGDRFEEDNSLDPDNPDTDADGFADGLELVAGADPFRDSSVPERINDPISDGIIRTGNPPLDSDRDGLSDSLDSFNGSRPNAADTDTDGFSDGLEFLMGSDPTDTLSVPNFNVPFPPESTEESGSGSEEEEETASSAS